MTKVIKRNAGLLMNRSREDLIEIFLIHPGGPHWSTNSIRLL
jgi:predicted NUDIX family NTP pyrophosphohydrolase